METIKAGAFFFFLINTSEILINIWLSQNIELSLSERKPLNCLTHKNYCL